MTVYIKKGTTKEEFDKILKEMESKRKNKGVDTRKFCGTVKIEGDGLKIQKRLRNEWK
ncbi:MAG: hypothetical protein H7X71_07245 [Chitinophagales bacterium]|nr:hypothetical protein [Chitinophagales bacterium]